MKMMSEWLKLLRWPNLLLLAFMQVLFRYCLMEPVMNAQELPLLMDTGDFILLVLASVLIAAGGYLINDLEDIESDRINKPQRILVSGKIKHEQVRNLYAALSILGLACGGYLTWIEGYKYVGPLCLGTAGLLYFYSTTYKCIPLLGNIIVSLLSAISVFIVVLPEPSALSNEAVFSLCVAYMLFCFLLSMSREIVKDLEDSDGDRATGCLTLNLWAGTAISRTVALLFELALLSGLIGIQIMSRQWESIWPFLYLLTTVEIPIIVLIFLTAKAKTKMNWHEAANLSKFIMFTGVISMMIFYLTF